MTLTRVSFHLVITKPLKGRFCSVFSFLNYFLNWISCGVWRVSSCIVIAMSVFSIIRNRSHKNIFGNRGPSINPYGTPNIIDSWELHSEFIFVLYTLFLRELCTNLKADTLNPYAFNFAIRRLCERQLNAVGKSVRSSPNDSLMVIADFHFLSIDTRQCWALKPFLNAHWYLEKIIAEIFLI